MTVVQKYGLTLFLRVAVDVFPSKRRHEESSPSKVRVVGGPQREVYDQAKDMEAYHKEQAALARHKNTQLANENQYILAQLQTAQKLQAEQIALNKRLHEDLESSTRAIADMQRHEGQLEAQFIGDQAKLQAMVKTMLAQLLESQKLLMQQNNEVQQLSRLLDEKRDEAIQLRALNYLGKKKPQNKPPPRRGTRASLDPVRNSSTRTIEIPLDPIPMTGAPNVASNPKPKGKINPTPALADMFGTDVETLAELFGKFQGMLVPDDVVTVSVGKTMSKGTPRKNRNAIQPMDKELKKHINTVLRSAAYDKFNVRQVADFQMYNPAEADKVAACEEDCVDPPYDLFQWDFGPGYQASRWNQIMVEKVIDVALEDDGPDGLIAKAGVERDSLKKLMLRKLDSYRVEWKGFQPRFNEDLGRMETIQEARARGAQTFEQHQLAARSTSAKHRKFEDRVQTIIRTIGMKKDDGTANDIATWERLLKMVELLGEHGMSSEEEDHIEVNGRMVFIYTVKICIWHDPRVVEYLGLVDEQTDLFREDLPGRPRSSRFRNAHGSSNAPLGLPQALYNDEWLKKQKPAFVQKLRISKETFALFVAAPGRMRL
ncbi:hypothetical protein B0H16DRAFT_1452164 [Mycena metata]|uniref:Uncharacterized protein n=1 Tax=Mycena metata TaxID=1033252 RepID=A0AAD7NQ36_9AGAR|nr:hypothetical protein B0H16DRAFT_1452164 [Mycena metata]